MAGDAELVALRQNARENMRAFNDEIDHRKRSELLKNWFGKTGQKIYMEPSLSLDYGSNIFVGENFYANFNCTILDTCPVTFGNNVISHRTSAFIRPPIRLIRSNGTVERSTANRSRSVTTPGSAALPGSVRGSRWGTMLSSVWGKCRD